jgi:hypothetical protein
MAAPITSDVARAADVIRRGGLAAFATETVYGLGANALDPIAAAHTKPEDDESDHNAHGPRPGKILLWVIGLPVAAFVLILALIIAGVI